MLLSCRAFRECWLDAIAHALWLWCDYERLLSFSSQHGADQGICHFHLILKWIFVFPIDQVTGRSWSSEVHLTTGPRWKSEATGDRAGVNKPIGLKVR
jgi:hypothetical protein